MMMQLPRIASHHPLVIVPSGRGYNHDVKVVHHTIACQATKEKPRRNLDDVKESKLTVAALVSLLVIAKKKRRLRVLCRAVTEVHDAISQEQLFVDAWERNLAGRKGNIWTEPELFTEIVTSLNTSHAATSKGPIHFERVSAQEDVDKDILLYVPGIDFAGAFAAEQFRGLIESGFELWRCFVGPDDRTSFVQMMDCLKAWITCRLQKGRKVVLLGESFGGLLSLAVALQLGKASLKGLVLVNPATSFSRTVWPLLGRALTIAPVGESSSQEPLSSDLLTVLQEMQSRAVRSPYAYLGSMALTGAVADATQISRIVSRIATTILDDSSPKSQPGGSDPLLQGFLTYPENLAKLLPPDTVRFRLRFWLRDGCENVAGELRRRRPDGTAAGLGLPPTLLLASDGDRLLDSKTEAERLRPDLTARCGDRRMFQVVELKGAGHAPLDDRVDLAALIKASPIYQSPKPRTDYISEYVPPTLEKLEEGSKNIEPIASIVSPVFCSWDEHAGKRRFGLEGVPDPSDVGRPVILIGNHQLFALELGPLVREFLIEKGFAPRGLAHPINFPEVAEEMFASRSKPSKPSDTGPLDAFGLPFELRAAAKASFQAASGLLGAANPSERANEFRMSMRRSTSSSENSEAGVGESFGVGGGFAKWGAVPVTPRNFFRLLQRKEAVLLFPGGAREACHGEGEKYQLFWPAKTDFVRVAARFNALIVPFASIGSADNVRPGSRKEGMSEMLSVEGGGFMPVSEALREVPQFPNVSPRFNLAQQTAPGFGDRFYYSFGAPVDLKDLDPKDKDGCDAMYAKIKENVESEIRWLLETRVKDPYRDFVRRQVFERIAALDDSTPRQVLAGPLKGKPVKSYGKRAPAFEL